MEQSHRFFENRACKYFPCHKGVDEGEFNCLFCYCPLNPYENCPGTPRFIEKEDGRRIKDCSNCTFVHHAKNYDAIIQFLKNPE